MNFRAQADLSNLQRVFGEINRRAADWRAPLVESGDPIRAEYAREWASHGPGWAPNSKGDNDLVVTGALRDSFCKKGAAGNLAQITTREGKYGSKLPYAALIQSGGIGPAKNGHPIKFKAHAIARNPSPLLLAQLGTIASKHFTNLGGRA